MTFEQRYEWLGENVGKHVWGTENSTLRDAEQKLGKIGEQKISEAVSHLTNHGEDYEFYYKSKGKLVYF